MNTPSCSSNTAPRSTEQSVLCLVSALVENIQDQDTLAKLGDILEKRKLQLG